MRIKITEFKNKYFYIYHLYSSEKEKNPSLSNLDLIKSRSTLIFNKPLKLSIINTDSGQKSSTGKAQFFMTEPIEEFGGPSQSCSSIAFRRI